MKMSRNLLVAALTAAASATWAQNPPMEGPPGIPPPGSPFGMEMQGSKNMGMAPQARHHGSLMMENLPAPELIMQNQQALALSDAQKSSIRELMKKSMEQFTDLEWQESAEREALKQMLKESSVNEPKAIAQLEKLLKIECDIKKIRLSTLIKLKNALTAEQLEKLKSLKPAMPPSLGGQPPQRIEDKGGLSNQKPGEASSSRPTPQ